MDEQSTEGMPLSFSGITLGTLSLQAFVRTLVLWSESSSQHRVHTIDARLLLELSSNQRLFQMMQSSDLNVLESRALATTIGLSLRRKTLAYCPRTQWVPLFLDALAEQGRSLFYLGGAKGAAQAWVDSVSKAFPGLRVQGRDGLFEKWGPENDRVLSVVNHIGPNVVFVGFGSPYQDEYAAVHQKLLRAPLIVTVGDLAECETGIRPEGPVRVGPLRTIGTRLETPRKLVEALALMRVLEAGLRERSGRR